MWTAQSQDNASGGLPICLIAQHKALAERERLRLETEAVQGAFGVSKITTTFRQAGQDYVRWKRLEGKNTRNMDYELPKIYDAIGDIKITDLTSASLQVFAAGAWPVQTRHGQAQHGYRESGAELCGENS